MYIIHIYIYNTYIYIIHIYIIHIYILYINRTITESYPLATGPKIPQDSCSDARSELHLCGSSVPHQADLLRGEISRNLLHQKFDVQNTPAVF